jgi:hypothetical protein
MSCWCDMASCQAGRQHAIHNIEGQGATAALLPPQHLHSPCSSGLQLSKKTSMASPNNASLLKYTPKWTSLNWKPAGAAQHSRVSACLPATRPPNQTNKAQQQHSPASWPAKLPDLHSARSHPAHTPLSCPLSCPCCSPMTQPAIPTKWWPSMTAPLESLKKAREKRVSYTR